MNRWISVCLNRRGLQYAWLCRRLSLVCQCRACDGAHSIYVFFENSNFSNMTNLVSFKFHMMKFHQSFTVWVCVYICLCAWVCLLAFFFEYIGKKNFTSYVFVFVYVCLILPMIHIELVRFAYIWISRQLKTLTHIEQSNSFSLFCSKFII